MKRINHLDWDDFMMNYQRVMNAQRRRARKFDVGGDSENKVASVKNNIVSDPYAFQAGITGTAVTDRPIGPDDILIGGDITSEKYMRPDGTTYTHVHDNPGSARMPTTMPHTADISDLKAAQTRYHLDHPLETMQRNSEMMSRRYGVDWRDNNPYGMNVGNGEDAVNLLYATPYWATAAAYHTGRDAFNFYRDPTAKNGMELGTRLVGNWMLPYGLGKLSGTGLNVFTQGLLNTAKNALTKYPKTTTTGLIAGGVSSVPFIREPIRKRFSPHIMDGLSLAALSPTFVDAFIGGMAGLDKGIVSGIANVNPYGSAGDNNWIEYGQKDFYPKLGYAQNSIAQGTMLMSRPDQDK